MEAWRVEANEVSPLSDDFSAALTQLQLRPNFEAFLQRPGLPAVIKGAITQSLTNLQTLEAAATQKASVNDVYASAPLGFCARGSITFDGWAFYADGLDSLAPQFQRGGTQNYPTVSYGVPSVSLYNPDLADAMKAALGNGARISDAVPHDITVSFNTMNPTSSASLMTRIDGSTPS
jgi:hypothetical protein